MAGTPFAKVLETIAEVERMQVQFADLSATVKLIVARLDALEKAGPRSGP